MKTFLKLIVVQLLISTVNIAPAQNFKWAKTQRSSLEDNSSKLTVDMNGNIIACGTFNGIFDADPGPGLFNLTPVGTSDIFIEKLDSAGNLIWAGSIGCTNYNIYVNDVKTDQNAIYITGAYQGSGDFDPGPGVTILPALGGLRAFFMKLDPAGNLIWAKNIGTGFTTRGMGIDVDESGNVYVTGEFSGFLDIDPDTAVTNYYSSLNGYDFFLIKLNSNGNFVWGFGIGGNSDAHTTYLQYQAGKLYLCGSYSADADFDPWAGSSILTGTSTEDHAFIAVNDSSSLLCWAIGINETDLIRTKNLAIDPLGNVLISGYFYDYADFDPTAGIVATTCTQCGFVASYNPNGVFRWVNWFGDTNGITVQSVATDNLGNIYCTGTFKGTIDFDPGPGTAMLAADSTSWNTFLYSSDNNGNLRWLRGFPSTSDETGTDIAFTTSSDFYFYGYFNGTIVADSATSVSLATTGNDDVFLMKFGDFISASNEITTQNGNIGIYPNPTHNKLYLKGFDPSLKYSISIFDMSGKKLKDITLSNQSEFNIDLDLPSGGYNVRTESAQEVIISRIYIAN